MWTYTDNELAGMLPFTFYFIHNHVVTRNVLIALAAFESCDICLFFSESFFKARSQVQIRNLYKRSF